MVVENQSKQRLVQDANSKISQQLAQIRDLEKLVLDQHSMIDSIQKMHCLSDNYQQQLISTQQELQTVYTENDILQKKCRKLEDDSKYLANQIDELLPQLFMKNSKIERLEQELFEVKSRQGHDVVDCATQFDCSSNVTDRSVQCSLGIDLFESANASPPLRVHDPSNTTITSFDDHRASDSHLQALMNPVKSEQREKLDAPIKVRKMKSKVEARRNQPITIQAKNTPKQPQSLEFPQSVPELSCHNDIYNQSMEIYSSSLFDLVEKMEVLESTLLPSTSGRKNQR